MKWPDRLRHKWFPPYCETGDFKRKLMDLEAGSVVWLYLKDCGSNAACFVIKNIGEKHFDGNVLIFGPMGSSLMRDDVRIEFKNIRFLICTGVNLFK